MIRVLCYIKLCLFIAICYSCNNILDNDADFRKTLLDDGTNIESIFPNKVGNKWYYEVLYFPPAPTTGQDSLVVYDTLIVSIISEILLNNNKIAKKWYYNYKKNYRDSYYKYILIDKNNIYEYDSIEDKLPIKIYEFSLYINKCWYVGNDWDSIKHKDTAKVQSLSVYNFQNIKYDIYSISRILKIYLSSSSPQTSPSILAQERIDFAPRLGIVIDEKGVNYKSKYKKMILYDCQIE